MPYVQWNIYQGARCSQTHLIPPQYAKKMTLSYSNKEAFYEKRNSLRTGEPANSGFSKMQLKIVSPYSLAPLAMERTSRSTRDPASAARGIWAGIELCRGVRIDENGLGRWGGTYD
jgi:hypothetical protein